MATTADDVWRLLGELIEAQKDTACRFQESDRRFEETKQLMREQSQETERLLKEQNAETGRHINQAYESRSR